MTLVDIMTIQQKITQYTVIHYSALVEKIQLLTLTHKNSQNHSSGVMYIPRLNWHGRIIQQNQFSLRQMVFCHPPVSNHRHNSKHWGPSVKISNNHLTT